MRPLILVVEDEPDIRALIVNYFLRYADRSAWQAYGMEPPEIVAAADGRCAMDLLQSPAHQIDLVILDHHLPDTDAFTAYDCIRQFSGVPVVFFTSHSDMDTRRQFAIRTFATMIRKPFDIRQVEQLLINVLARRCQRSNEIKS